MPVANSEPSSGAISAELPARWSRIQRAKNTAIYGAIRLVALTLRTLPRPLLNIFSTALGALAYCVAVKDRDRARQQLATAMPELSPGEVDQEIRKMFKFLSRSAFDALILDRLLGQKRSIVLPEHIRDLFRDALSEGKGVVAVSAHVGNWELCAQSMAAAGLPVSVIASPLYDPRLTRMVDRFRSRHGATVLWRGDRRVSKDMLRVFKRNEVLAMLIDQDTRVQGTFVPFFGRPAYTPVAAAQLALRFEAPIIIGFARHADPQTPYRFDFERFVYDNNATPEALTAELTRRIERVIREDPGQWVWFHRRWRTRSKSPSSSENELLDEASNQVADESTSSRTS